MRPPLQPLLRLEQSTNRCSERRAQRGDGLHLVECKRSDHETTVAATAPLGAINELSNQRIVVELRYEPWDQQLCVELGLGNGAILIDIEEASDGNIESRTANESYDDSILELNSALVIKPP